jgi:hypothetical protein
VPKEGKWRDKRWEGGGGGGEGGSGKSKFEDEEVSEGMFSGSKPSSNGSMTRVRQCKHRQTMIHIFHLPPSLCNSFVQRTLLNQPHPQVQHNQEALSHTSLSCNLCLAVSFAHLDEQRAHARSDWHRYNVKTKLAGGKPVNEAAFAQLLNGLYINMNPNTDCMIVIL